MAANTWLVWVSTEFEFFHWKQRRLWFAGVRQVGEGLCVQLQWWSFIKVAASQRWIQSRHAVKHTWKLQRFYTHFPSKYTFNDFEAAVNWCLNLVTILSHLTDMKDSWYRWFIGKLWLVDSFDTAIVSGTGNENKVTWISYIFCTFWWMDNVNRVVLHWYLADSCLVTSKVWHKSHGILQQVCSCYSPSWCYNYMPQQASNCLWSSGSLCFHKSLIALSSELK